MMPPILIRSVVVGTDLGAASDGTVHSAAELARRHGAELHVVHAYEEPGFGAEVRDVVALQRSHRSALQAQLDRALPAGFTAIPRTVLGPPAESILRVAEEVSADLLVLGPHRTRGLADGLLGSTADRLVKSARVPCLVLSHPLDQPLRRVVVPSDLTPSARGAVRVALGWADAQRTPEGDPPAEVLLVHVLSAGEASADQGAATGVRRALQAIADGEAERGGHTGVPTSVEVVVSGATADELLRFADSRDADLLVMGTQGDGTLMRALQGSVSSAVVRRALLPVLLVPPAVWRAAPPAREVAAPEMV